MGGGRESVSEREWGRGRERESQAGLDLGLDLMNRQITRRVEIKRQMLNWWSHPGASRVFFLFKSWVNISLYVYATFCVSSHLSIDIWVVSTFWLLWIRLLWWYITSNLSYFTLYGDCLPKARIGGPKWLSWLSVWLDFGSGHDLMVMRSSPTFAPLLGMESAWDSVSPSLSAPPLLMLSLTKTNKSMNLFSIPLICIRRHSGVSCHIGQKACLSFIFWGLQTFLGLALGCCFTKIRLHGMGGVFPGPSCHLLSYTACFSSTLSIPVYCRANIFAMPWTRFL